MPSVKRINHSFGEEVGGHVVHSESTQHRVDKDQATTRAEMFCFPSRQVPIETV
jgi:hypothetical protein